LSLVTCHSSLVIRHLSLVIHKAMGHKKDKLKEREKEKKSKTKEDIPPVHGDVSINYEEEGDDKFPKHLYEEEIAKLQVELVRLQEWIKYKGLRVVVLFEGRDAAGKGGAIKRITESLNPRVCRVVALGVPTEKEKTQWYFQRYVSHLPAAGEMVLFDRSWYNRAGVERVMGFCNDEEYWDFLRSCPNFESMLIRSGIILIKYWFSVSDKEQERRFLQRISDPTRRWKISPMDVESRTKWVDYSKAKDEMFAYTDTKLSPWYVVEADDKRRARLNCICHLLSLVPHEDVPRETIILPPLVKDKSYVRPPMSEQTFVPQKY
jgi:polyphosphate kinase 2